MSELLQVNHLKKYFKTPGGMLHAVDDVSFRIDEGKTLGVVGESGCGKSTLGRTVLGLLQATDGQIVFDGRDVTNLSAGQRRALCRDRQIIFQDPYSSLNPRRSVAELIATPLRINRAYRSSAEREKRVYELMDTVGLSRRYIYSYPHELDGGRRQRVGIARALAMNPKFIVCDEPVSALDVSIQAQILNLLMDLQEASDLTYIFITHNLSVVKHVSSDIMVMYMGCLVEKAGTEELFERHLHPYTKGLLSAIPIPSLHVQRNQILLEGEVTSPVNPKPGCRFCSRCVYAKDICRTEDPAIEEVLPGHFVACHCVREINDL